jgi:hypothetical protein
LRYKSIQGHGFQVNLGGVHRVLTHVVCFRGRALVMLCTLIALHVSWAHALKWGGGAAGTGGGRKRRKGQRRWGIHAARGAVAEGKTQGRGGPPQMRHLATGAKGSGTFTR